MVHSRILALSRQLLGFTLYCFQKRLFCKDFMHSLRVFMFRTVGFLNLMTPATDTFWYTFINNVVQSMKKFHTQSAPLVCFITSTEEGNVFTSVCLCVCVSVNRITQKLVDRFS